jgi:copper chaperone CopZ
MATETTLQITGMHCGSRAQRLSGVLQRSDGVIKADVDPAGEARIRFDETRMDEQRLGELVRTAGFDLAGGDTA